MLNFTYTEFARARTRLGAEALSGNIGSPLG